MRGKINREGSSPALSREAASIYLLPIDGVAFGDILVDCKLMVCCISQATLRQKLEESERLLSRPHSSRDQQAQMHPPQPKSYPKPTGKSKGTAQCQQA